MQEKREVGTYGKKLTETEARQVLTLKGIFTQRELGRMFGISQASVSDIHVGRSWPDLEPIL